MTVDSKAHTPTNSTSLNKVVNIHVNRMLDEKALVKKGRINLLRNGRDRIESGLTGLGMPLPIHAMKPPLKSRNKTSSGLRSRTAI